jgi:methyl-accepting chemotaxis protein
MDSRASGRARTPVSRAALFKEEMMLTFVDDWRLSKKILAAFALLSLLVGGITLNSYISSTRLKSAAQAHVHGLAGLSRLADVISDIKEQRIIVYSYLNAVKADDIASLETRIAASQTKTNDDIALYGKVVDADFRPEWERLKSLAADLAGINNRIFALRKSGDFGGSLLLIKDEGKTRSHNAIAQAEKLIALTRSQSDTRGQEGDIEADRALLLSTLLALLGFAGLAMIWFLIDRTVAKPIIRLADVTASLAKDGEVEVPYRDRKDELGKIAEAVELFRAMAVARAESDARATAEQKLVMASLRESLAALTDGDLTRPIEADFPSNYAELKNHYNAALDSLSELVRSVTDSATTIRTGSNEIAQASEDLAHRTQSNAANLEETSAAIAQMEERLRTTASAAGGTVRRADDALAVVGSGRAIAADAVEAMDRVSESAKSIDSVIGGLDKIAFQTRVLAMNAAVEAGRAGDAGRGFAVVADLVSSLAMRAEEEARRASDQLSVTQNSIATAVEAVQKVDGALAGISSDVGEVHILLGQIAVDNEAQSSAVSQISVTVGAMNLSTQQNAAMVEETSAAARSLTDEVNALSDRAALFRTGRDSVPSRKPRSFAPARI